MAMTDFPQRLRERRKAKGWPQSRIASLFGVTRGCVTHWESGRATPNEQTIEELKRLLEMT